MRYAYLIILAISVAVFGWADHAAAQDDSSTQPAATTSPALEMLDGGRVRFTPPDDFIRRHKNPDSMSVLYETPNGTGTIYVSVTPQPGPLGPSDAKQMALAIGKGIRERAKRDDSEVLLNPRVVPDDRFLLKVRDVLRAPDGNTYDRLQIYRMLDIQLVLVSAVVRKDADQAAEAPDAPQAVHEAGERLLDQAVSGRGPSPSAFKRTGIRLYPPAEWVEEKIDDPNAIVATYTERGGPGRMIVRSRVIPKKDRRNPQRLRQFIDGLAAEEDMSGAEEIDDQRFLRSLRRDMQVGGKQLHLESRFVMLGDVIIAVTTLGPPERAEELAYLATEVASRAQRLYGR